MNDEPDVVDGYCTRILEKLGSSGLNQDARMEFLSIFVADCRIIVP
jgi:hypothetical protein